MCFDIGFKHKSDFFTEDPILKKVYNLQMIHIACYFGNEQLVKRLLKNRNCVNVLDNYGRTPLHYARIRKNGNKNDKVANILIRNGASDLKPKDKFGRTPLDMYILYSK